MGNKGLLTIIAVCVIGVFTILLIQTHGEETSDNNSINEIVEEIDDEIDDNTDAR